MDMVEQTIIGLLALGVWSWFICRWLKDSDKDSQETSRHHHIGKGLLVVTSCEMSREAATRMLEDIRKVFDEDKVISFPDSVVSVKVDGKLLF